jgi:predicted metalloprotease with PDZ domain
MDRQVGAREWVLTHEMVHLGFPSLARRHLWLEEGIATYVEPIARARSGDLLPEKVWLDLVEGLPQGLPENGDRGLDETPTWGRTYWGGALYCLLADVEIRERTAGRRSLDDALKGVIAAGGNISSRWPIERALEIGDRATGTDVLSRLYDKMAHHPFPVDLEAMWRRLGIAKAGTGVTFDDRAPDAALRREITAPAPKEGSR